MMMIFKKMMILGGFRPRACVPHASHLFTISINSLHVLIIV
ncbi:hypothetical protein [Caudoviricetes sp.]|nr:hypothetical protein [Caudoviricetes sp.]